MQGRTCEKGVGGASSAVAPGAKMGSHVNISDKKNYFMRSKIVILLNQIK